jgi:hypothetical protein
VDPLDTSTWKDDNVSLVLSAWTYVKNVVEWFETVFGTELRLQKTPHVRAVVPSGMWWHTPLGQ